MQIFIKTLTGITLTLDCDSFDNLKQQILVREGLEIDRQRLNYGGKELDSESLCDGITVHLSSRMMGGEKKKKKKKKKKINKIVKVPWFWLLLIIGVCFVFYGIGYFYKNSNQTPQITIGENLMIGSSFLCMFSLLGVSSYYASIYPNGDFSAILFVAFVLLMLLLPVPFILRNVLKFMWVEYESPIITTIMTIVLIIVFSVFYSPEGYDEWIRSIVVNSSAVLILSYYFQKFDLFQRYITKSGWNSFRRVNFMESTAIYNSLLLTGVSAAFLASIL